MAISPNALIWRMDMLTKNISVRDYLASVYGFSATPQFGDEDYRDVPDESFPMIVEGEPLLITFKSGEIVSREKITDLDVILCSDDFKRTLKQKLAALIGFCCNDRVDFSRITDDQGLREKIRTLMPLLTLLAIKLAWQK